MASLPLDANVLFMTVMATKMPFVGAGVAGRVSAGPLQTSRVIPAAANQMIAA